MVCQCEVNMIVDDFVELGIGLSEEELDEAHVVKLPYGLGVRFLNNETTQFHEGMEFYIDPLVDKLTPVKTKVDGGYLILDAEWGKCPYERMVFFHSEKERSIVTVLSIIHDGLEKWFCTLYIRTARGLVAIPSICVIKDNVLMLNGSMNDPDSDVYFYKLAYNITRQISGEELAEWWRNSLLSTIRYTVPSIGNDNPAKSPIICWDLARVVLVTTSLMNARNIVCVSNTPDYKLQKSRVSKGKKPLLVWHELKLTPFKKIHKQGNTYKTNELMPLHWVRGHFKVFTKEKPLFGKFSGRYWWQPHIAGKDEDRFVKKSYKVEV